MRFEHPASQRIERLSPTAFEILHECPLRFAFSRLPGNAFRSSGSSARLGTICHNVLDEAVRTDALRPDGWRINVERLWDRHVALEEAKVEAGAEDGPARSWSGYQLKRARLFQVAGHLRDLLSGLPKDAEVLTEQPLVAASGRLYGRPDLLIRSDETHLVIDYKSGGVLDRETSLPRDAYVNQLQLYSWLEFETTGSWPHRAYLFPLQGAPIELEVVPQKCQDLATEALRALDEYNDSVPTTPRAAPTPAHCHWCPSAAVCPSFWHACDSSWQPEVLAVAGTVTNAFVTPLGGVTISVEAERGSLTEPVVVIKNIDGSLGDIHVLKARDAIAATRLVAEPQGSGYRLAVGSPLSIARHDSN